MSHLLVNLKDIYNTYFQSGYKVKQPTVADAPDEYSSADIPKKDTSYKTVFDIPITKSRDDMLGREVFLPVLFRKSQQDFLEIHCCTIRTTSKKTIVRTAVSERVGTVKEQFNIGDYIFTIKGVLIGKNRNFPDDEISKLRELYETTDNVELHNALAELFMTGSGSRRIAIESIEFPEVQGKDMHHRPFVMTCETDFIDTLIISE